MGQGDRAAEARSGFVKEFAQIVNTPQTTFQNPINYYAPTLPAINIIYESPNAKTESTPAAPASFSFNPSVDQPVSLEQKPTMDMSGTSGIKKEYDESIGKTSGISPVLLIAGGIIIFLFMRKK